MTADPAVAVEVVGLRRSYRSPLGILRRRSREIEALRGITFSINRGELFGLLGPNGAGKTTTIKVLTTLLLPSAGTARVLGFDVARRPPRERTLMLGRCTRDAPSAFSLYEAPARSA